MDTDFSRMKAIESGWKQSGALSAESVKAVPGRKPNWLLRGLIALSVGIHVVIFMHITGIYRSRPLNYIELTLKEAVKHPARNIPRPRHFHVQPYKPDDPQRIRIHRISIPPLKPVKLDDVTRKMVCSRPEPVSIPALPAIDAPRIQHWVPEPTVDNARKTAVQNPSPRVSNTDNDYVNPAAYFNMVRLRIERHKRYPEVARTRQIEGRVTIRFVIGKDGRLISAKVKKSAGKRILDQAALNAVKESSPFQRPPANLFKGSVPLQITIVFELTS